MSDALCGLHSSPPGLSRGGSTQGFADRKGLGYSSHLNPDWSLSSVEE